MSYLRKRMVRTKKSKRGLGDFSSAIEGLFSNVTNAAGAALSFSQDPYLPEVACRFEQLAAVNGGHAPGGCSETAPGLPGGVGLGKVVTPLRWYVYAQQHKWVYPVAIAAIIGIPMALGYSLGSGSRSSST